MPSFGRYGSTVWAIRRTRPSVISMKGNICTEVPRSVDACVCVVCVCVCARARVCDVYLITDKKHTSCNYATVMSLLCCAQKKHQK